MNSKLCVILATLSLAAAGLASSHAPAPTVAMSAGVVISQVYGGGGNLGATYASDYVELFNRATWAVAVDGVSVQYASATGAGNFASNPVTALSGVIPAGGYYLVQLAGGVNGVALPTPDATGSANMSSTSGKVALVNSVTGLECNGGAVPCSPGQLVMIADLVGYGSANFFEGAGPAPASSTTTAVVRNRSGCTETDSNSTDFAIGTPSPRNSTSPTFSCAAPWVASTDPTAGAVNVPLNANIWITFSEAVTVIEPWFTISCAVSGSHAASTSGGPVTFALDPGADFVDHENCQVRILASQVTDQHVTHPPEHMASDYTFAFATYPVAVAYLPIARKN